MERMISDKFGCQIVEKNSKLFMRFDNGEIASKIVEIEITREEAEKAIISEKDSYEVILKAQLRGN